MSEIRNRRDLELGIELGLDRIDEAGIDLIEGIESARIDRDETLRSRAL